MFYSSAIEYIYPPSPIEDPMGYNAFFPIELDTEYTHPAYKLNNPSQTICTNLTVQCRAIAHKQGIIYAHPDIAAISRHKPFKHGFAVIDYLEDYGHDVALSRLPAWDTSTEGMPWIQIDFIAFFAVAELFRVFQGVYREDVKTLCSLTGNYGIEQGRRVRAYTKLGNKLFNYVEMPWILILNQQPYRIRLQIYDTSAVHGTVGYEKFCSNSGIKLEYKDNFSSREKAIMDVMYNERPEDFDNYALGDLFNHKALIGNNDNFRLIYHTLGLDKYFIPPRLTIGATVSRMIEAGIKNLFNSEPDNRDVINVFCKYGSADWLKRITAKTGCLNAKVDGGRCRNNRPIDTTVKGVICDIDISGCYGEGLRVQTYPLGIPCLIDYPANSTDNDYQTLRQFLKQYSKELVPGLWQARVSCKDGVYLKYRQDYLASWYPPKDISKMPTDSEFEATDQWWTVDNVGEIKILTNEVNHAIITHDFIQWLDNVASPRQRKELLDTLIVETALYYRAQDRVNSIDELIEAHANHTGKNTTKIGTHKGRTRKTSVEEPCYKWYGVNLGELLVDKLLLERKKYAKKTAFNELYKLCINTIYGDMVSPFFTVGNVVVGNNITARARALAWCMEKGFHGWQSITDGCAFDVNRVLHTKGNSRITGEMVVNLYANDNYKEYTFLPLNDLTVTDKSLSIKFSDSNGKSGLLVPFDTGDILLTKEDALTWINATAMKHLQRLFPNLDILHQKTLDVKGKPRIGQFEFEAKGLFDTAVFHGTANYGLALNGEWDFKMRSYSKKEHKIVELADDLQIIDDSCKPSEIFLKALQTPNRMGRSSVFLRNRILKVGDYKRNYRVWKDTNVYPGCTIETPSLIREFSLSQFTFKTHEQLLSWRKEYERLIRLYGQSYEMFFINQDGTLNYQTMIETIDGYIRDGKLNFFDGLDKRAANLYRKYLKHSQLECLDRVQKQLQIRYHGASEFLETFNDNDDYAGNTLYSDD